MVGDQIYADMLNRFIPISVKYSTYVDSFVNLRLFTREGGDEQSQARYREKTQDTESCQEDWKIRKTCRYFGISRAIFYRWRDAYDRFGEEGLINKKPCPKNRSLRLPVEIEEKILYIRKTHHLGPDRITWYLKRYHDITVSGSGVYRA
jgi:ribosomal protein S14